MVVRAIKTARKLPSRSFLAVLGKGAGSPKRMNRLTWLGAKLLFGDVQLVMPLSGKVRRHFFLCGFYKCGVKISCVGRADRNTPHAGDAFVAICSGEVRCGDSSCGADTGTDSALDAVLISFGMDLDAAHFDIRTVSGNRNAVSQLSRFIQCLDFSGILVQIRCILGIGAVLGIDVAGSSAQQQLRWLRRSGIRFRSAHR